MTYLQTAPHPSFDGFNEAGRFTTETFDEIMQPGYSATVKTGVLSTVLIDGFSRDFCKSLAETGKLDESLAYGARMNSLELIRTAEGLVLGDATGRMSGVDAFLIADDDGTESQFFEIGYTDVNREFKIYRGEWKDLIDGYLRLLTEKGVRTFHAENVHWSRKINASTHDGLMLSSRILEISGEVEPTLLTRMVTLRVQWRLLNEFGPRVGLY